MGTRRVINPANIILDPTQPIGSLQFPIEDDHIARYLQEALIYVTKKFKIDPKTPFELIPANAKDAYFFGNNVPLGRGVEDRGYSSEFRGVSKWLEELYDDEDSRSREELEKLFSFQDCDDCKGSRLRAESRAVRVNNMAISDYARLPLERT